jgi:hypothetical protein
VKARRALAQHCSRKIASIRRISAPCHARGARRPKQCRRSAQPKGGHRACCPSHARWR